MKSQMPDHMNSQVRFDAHLRSTSKLGDHTPKKRKKVSVLINLNNNHYFNQPPKFI
jgi:hypothetical protein